MLFHSSQSGHLEVRSKRLLIYNDRRMLDVGPFKKFTLPSPPSCYGEMKKSIDTVVSPAASLFDTI